MLPVPTDSEIVDALRSAGARFGFLHGSRVDGSAGPDSDTDVAGWWGTDAPASWQVAVPDGVDLVVLDDAPLWLAGRIALDGRLLFDDDPRARVRWQAETRNIWLDERVQVEASRREYTEALADGR